MTATPAITLSAPLPNVVRVNQELGVSGRLRNAPPRTRAALEAMEAGVWKVLVRAAPGKQGRFDLRWEVTGPAYRSLTLRVAAVRRRHRIAATAAHTATVGPAAVYCATPVPPATNIPVGYGWIVGGLYGEGGAYPGVYECISYAYTLTVMNSSGKVVATQQVGPKKSYTVVLPAGSYTLRGGCGSGSGTVTADKQSDVNMYCLYP